MKLTCSHCGCANDVEQGIGGQGAACQKCGACLPIDNPRLQPCADCYCLISKRAEVCPYCGGIAGGRTAQVAGDSVGMYDEKEMMVCHPAAISYLFQIIQGVLLAVVLIGLVILAQVLIDIYFTSYRITNKRIVVDTGFFNKKQNEIWIKDMRGASMKQTLWQRIIGVGNISIGTAATAGAEIQMPGIKNPRYVVDTINSLRMGN